MTRHLAFQHTEYYKQQVNLKTMTNSIKQRQKDKEKHTKEVEGRKLKVTHKLRDKQADGQTDTLRARKR